MAVRIYGDNQLAGEAIVTTGKGKIPSDGLEAYALRVKSEPVSGAVFTTTPSSHVVFYNDTTTPLAAAATFTGTARDAGAAAGTSVAYAKFNAFFLADQAGTAYIEGSNDNATWFTVATSALSANTPLALSTPVMTRYHRVKLVNGATLQGSVTVNSNQSAT